MSRRRRRGGYSFPHFSFIMDQRPGFFVGILFALLLVLGILFWYLLFDLGTPDAGKILTVEICVNVLSLLINIIMICKVGYDDFLTNFRASYLLNMLFSVIGLYIAGVQLIENTGGSQLIEFWRFVTFVFIAALMALLPTIVICGVMWLIMSIFGTYR